MRVLLAIDGSEPAARAARLVGQVAWPDGSAIRVLAVIQQAFDPAIGMPALAISPDIVEDVATAVRAEAERVTMATAHSLEAEGRLVESAVKEGRPATVIVDDAREFGAHLVVVGSHGRGPAAATVLGSVSAEVAESAPCSVLIARSPSISRLVLAYDRSEHSDAARHLIATMPGFRGLQVRVVSVEGLAPGWYAWLAPESGPEIQAFENAWEEDRRELAAFVEREAKGLNDAGLVATAGVREGDPGAEIVASAREEKADLIVMGSRGRTGLSSIVLGSVSRKVLSHAPCSVLIVRRSHRLT
jgi:nucleotide-binding universal stress UspA family protein